MPNMCGDVSNPLAAVYMWQLHDFRDNSRFNQFISPEIFSQKWWVGAAKRLHKNTKYVRQNTTGNEKNLAML
jgi:hypothetical protein